MKTPQDYLASLRTMKRRVYMHGKQINDIVDNPIIRPSTNSVAMTYYLAQLDEYQDLATAKSHLNGNMINRFTHIQQNKEDLLKKVQLLRLMGQKTASCFQRCAGLDALNTLYSVTYDIDRVHNTNYHSNFVKFLNYVQEEDLVCDAAMTDPKGNRSLSPLQQVDPDLYLRIVEQNEEGIIVRGAKAHQTGAINSHEIIVVPTASLNSEAKAYAVAFAVPADTIGVSFIYGRQPSDLRRLVDNWDVGNRKFGGHEALVIFENVFVPWERVFMCGETDFTRVLVERFAGYHRASYGGCKTGVGDVLIGTAAKIAHHSGVDNSSHIQDKLVEMVHLNETLFSCGIASSTFGNRLNAGNYIVDTLLANVCKLNVTRFPFEISRLAQEICGGLLVTLPAAEDFKSPLTGEILYKYFQAANEEDTEEKIKAIRLLEYLTIGPGAACYLTESVHGAGSPQAQKIMIRRLANFPEKINICQYIYKDNNLPWEE
ncbi:4-hydroxybutyryl-CoA dehydratase [Clostridiales bacterium PH28_bin88]|nr:4-hydroxybutyryl-CoA dehydratase [Clostridiales bacterium PH28_bin88]